MFDSWVGKIRWRRDRPPTPVFLGFPCDSAGKESKGEIFPGISSVGNSSVSTLEQGPYLQGTGGELCEGRNIKRSTTSSSEGARVLEIVDTEMRFHEETHCSALNFHGYFRFRILIGAKRRKGVKNKPGPRTSKSLRHSFFKGQT